MLISPEIGFLGQTDVTVFLYSETKSGLLWYGWFFLKSTVWDSLYNTSAPIFKIIWINFFDLTDNNILSFVLYPCQKFRFINSSKRSNCSVLLPLRKRWLQVPHCSLCLFCVDVGNLTVQFISLTRGMSCQIREKLYPKPTCIISKIKYAVYYEWSVVE
jgi:hypothetical protein